MATTQITISGGFHNVAPITARVTDGKLSIGQYKRLSNHLCGIKGCICGGRGAEIEGMKAAEFWEMLSDASAREYMARTA
jgi:hypothetical protein